MATRPLPAPRLYTRRAAAALLGGVSLPTLIKLEQEGRLTPVRLRDKQHSQVMYRASEIDRIVNGQQKETSDD